MTGPDMSGTEQGGDRHPDDLLSAFVDGELEPATAERVSAHLARCEPCRHEAEAVEAARTWIRQLPEIDSSGVVGGFLARHQRVVWAGAVFVVASTVVAVALAVTASALRPEVVPPIDTMVAVHAAANPEQMAGVTAVDDVREPYSAPPAMLGNRASLSRQALYAGGGMTVVVYGDRRAGSAVTVFEQHGSLEWDALPEGDRSSAGARPVWIRDGSPTVVVTEIGHLVVTVVASDRAAALTVADGLPPTTRGSTYHRVHDACQRVTELFALSGG